MKILNEHGALADLIRRARHRYISQMVLEQAAVALAIALAGCSVLVLLGTRILDWYWVGVVALGAFAVGVWRARRRVLSPYQIAQKIDATLGFEDLLPTAYYFREHPERTPHSALAAEQYAQAEEKAGTADLRLGLPFAWPRALYASGGLALLAVTLFGIRFGVTNSLDLRPSLVQIAWDALPGVTHQPEAARRNPPAKLEERRSKENGVTPDPWESKVLDSEGAPEGALNTVDTPDVNNVPNRSEAKTKSAGAESQDAASSPGENAEPGEKSPDGSQTGSGNSSRESKDGKSAKGTPDSKSQQGAAGDNSSLADKMRDALSNLMAKLKPNGKQPEGSSGSSQAQNGQQSAQQKPSGSQDKGSPAANKTQGDSNSDSEAQSDADSQSGEKSQSAQNGASKSGEKSKSPDGKSGVGSQDGDKSAREAAQLAAMGKISEILGKRAANITGEVMIESGSGKQQLKTQYSQRDATHIEAGGEINRDEVPLAYQQYVQQYFEEIRKQAASGKPVRKVTGVGN